MGNCGRLPQETLWEMCQKRVKLLGNGRKIVYFMWQSMKLTNMVECYKITACIRSFFF